MTKTTTVTVLKPFGYSDDGVHLRQLVDGETAEIRDDMVGDLIAAGLVTTGKPSKAAKAATRAKA